MSIFSRVEDFTVIINYVFYILYFLFPNYYLINNIINFFFFKSGEVAGRSPKRSPPPRQNLKLRVYEKNKIVTVTRIPKLKLGGGRYLSIEDRYIYFVLTKKTIDIV